MTNHKTFLCAPLRPLRLNFSFVKFHLLHQGVSFRLPITLKHLPTLFVAVIALVMLVYGPIAQPVGYHNFADNSVLFGLLHVGDVLSNLGFALVAVWGWLRLYPKRENPAILAGWGGYRLFLAGLFLTALGSGYYHLMPDNPRLFWDRWPIALTCAGILAAIRAETRPGINAHKDAIGLGIFATISVIWWRYTDIYGETGDLRPYLLLQALPLLLIPLWQWIYGLAKRDRMAFGLAIILYVAAKVTEILDHQIMGMLGGLSGHTLKHLLATLAAAVIVARLIERVNPASGDAAIAIAQDARE